MDLNLQIFFPQGCKAAQKKARWNGTRSCRSWQLSALSPSISWTHLKMLRWVRLTPVHHLNVIISGKTLFFLHVASILGAKCNEGGLCLFFFPLRRRSRSWSSRKPPPSPSVRLPPTRDRSFGKSSTRSTSCCRAGRWCQGGGPSPLPSILRAWTLSATNWPRSLWWVRLTLAWRVRWSVSQILWMCFTAPLASGDAHQCLT